MNETCKTGCIGILTTDGKIANSYPIEYTSPFYTGVNTGTDNTLYRLMSITKNHIDNKPEFVNMFEHIKDYKVYNKTTVVYFTDGTKETVVCNDEDNFDIEQGITMCVIKRMFKDTYKKYVRAAIKTKKANEKKIQRLEAANKEAKIRQEKLDKKNRENKLRMKARYEARLTVAIEEEKKKLRNK